MDNPLILASGSAYKRALLERLDLEFDTLPAGVDEAASPEEVPGAAAKAQEVGRRRPEAWVLGADQVIALDEQRFTKPGSPGQARAQLGRLSGRTHRLITAVALRAPDARLYEAAVEYAMEMRPLSEETIVEYVDRDRPLDCAGSYKIEAGGIRLFRSMRGDDYTAIVGLPLTRVWSLLEEAGYFG